MNYLNRCVGNVHSKKNSFMKKLERDQMRKVFGGDQTVEDVIDDDSSEEAEAGCVRRGRYCNRGQKCCKGGTCPSQESAKC
jgi:hypothetical protein